MYDQYFQWWQYAATRYLEMFTYQPFLQSGFGLSLERYFESKKTVDRLFEEMWRGLRLPPLEEVIRIHERLNLLEERCVSLQDQEGTPEGKVILENLRSLKESLEQLQHQISRTSVP